MPAEPSVLELNQGLNVFLRERIPGRESPLPVLRNPGSEEFPVPVNDDGRPAFALEKVAGKAENIEEGSESGKAPQPSDDYFPSLVTLHLSDAVQAFTDLSYMHSQLAEGRI